jgi:hypothetical protein
LPAPGFPHVFCMLAPPLFILNCFKHVAFHFGNWKLKNICKMLYDAIHTRCQKLF